MEPSDNKDDEEAYADAKDTTREGIPVDIGGQGWTSADATSKVNGCALKYTHRPTYSDKNPRQQFDSVVEKLFADDDDARNKIK